MPTVADPASPTTTQLFRREFLSAGGLNLVCGVLRKDFFPVDVSYEIRQAPAPVDTSFQLQSN